MVYYEKRAPPCIMWPTKMAFDVNYTEFLFVVFYKNNDVNYTEFLL